MIRSATVTLAFLILAACTRLPPAADGAASSRDLVLSLDAIRAEIPAGTVPQFRLTLKNVSGHPCRVLDADRRADLRHTYYHLVVLKNGKPVQVPIAISDPGPISEADWLVVPPDAARSFTLANFPEQIEVLPPGTYEAHVDFWQDPLRSHATAYASPVAKFTITP